MVGGEDCGHVRESNCGFLRRGVVDCASDHWVVFVVWVAFFVMEYVGRWLLDW